MEAPICLPDISTGIAPLQESEIKCVQTSALVFSPHICSSKVFPAQSQELPATQKRKVRSARKRVGGIFTQHGQLELYQEAIITGTSLFGFLFVSSYQNVNSSRAGICVCFPAMSEDGCIPSTQGSACHMAHVQQAFTEEMNSVNCDFLHTRMHICR